MLKPQMMGAYTQKNDELHFLQTAGTRIVCAPPAMAYESQMLRMLGVTTGYRIVGEHFLFTNGQIIAHFDALYLR